MADENTTSVRLFERRDDASSLILSAAILNDGGLELCEHFLFHGGGDRESIEAVSATHVGDVLAALATPEDPEPDLLRVLLARFGGRESALSEIYGFLKTHGIPLEKPWNWTSFDYYEW